MVCGATPFDNATFSSVGVRRFFYVRNAPTPERG